MAVEPYSALALGYDFVMRHVDYDLWAEYVHDLLSHHGTEIDHLVELGGGTGSLALRLQPLGEYRYTLTDGSEAMLRRARQKIATAGQPIRCVQADFTDVTLDDIGCSAPADAVVLVYDGLNYLLEEHRVAALFRCVYRLLRPGGIAVIDQSTPANSEADEGCFADEGATDAFSYVRESTYDPNTRRHETTFDLSIGGRHVRERHVQRAYSLSEIRALLSASPLSVLAAYDEFSMASAQARSTRVHWVLRRKPGESSSVA